MLKGGTALNLFFFDLPRLSVDIDLNYIGQLDRQEMLLERPEVEKALEAIFQREGLSIRPYPRETCRRKMAASLCKCSWREW